MLQRPLPLLQCVHHTEVGTTAPTPSLVPAPESAPEPAPVPTPAPAGALEPQHSPALEPQNSQELVVKRVKAALGRLAGRTSSSPTDLVVKLWQSNFNSFKGDIDRVLNDDNNNEEEEIMFRVFDWEEYEDQPAVIEAAGAALAWARHAKKNLQFSRGDYLYALNLLLYFLGALVPLQIFTPAEVNITQILPLTTRWLYSWPHLNKIKNNNKTVVEKAISEFFIQCLYTIKHLPIYLFTAG